MKKAISICILYPFAISAGYNQAGALDPGFDTDGIVISAFGNINRATIVQAQPDGSEHASKKQMIIN